MPATFLDLSYELRRTIYLEGLDFWRVDLRVKVEQDGTVGEKPDLGYSDCKLVVGDRACIKRQLLCELNQIPLLLVSRQTRLEVSNLVWQRLQHLHIRTKGIKIGPGCSFGSKWLEPRHTFEKLRDLLHSRPLWQLTDNLSCLSLPFYFADAVKDLISNEPWLMPGLRMLIFYDETPDASYPRYIPVSSRTAHNINPRVTVVETRVDNVEVLTDRLHRMTWATGISRTYEIAVQYPGEDGQVRRVSREEVL